MQENLSLVLNVLLLMGVIITIFRMIKSRRQNTDIVNHQPSIGIPEAAAPCDDIISVRKVDREFISEAPAVEPVLRPAPQPVIEKVSLFQEEQKPSIGSEPTSSVMMFLLAKENRQLAGYELLQTVLAAGLRFGEGQLFHRHQ